MKNRNRNGATILGVVLLSVLVAMLASAGLRAEGTRSISAVPNGVLYVRTADVGIGASAEMVDLTTATASLAAGFGTYHRTFSVCIENEESTSGYDLLVSFQPVGSFSVSQLTTPSDATVSTTVRIRAGLEPLCIDVQGAGWIWQSVGPNTVDANAIVSW
jgi:hypothetical protein